MPSQRTSSKPLQQIPTKWAVAIVAALICYTLLQPVLNRQFGWHLPALAGEKTDDVTVENESDNRSRPAEDEKGFDTAPESQVKSQSGESAANTPASVPPTNSQPTAAAAKAATSKAQTSPEQKANSNLRYGILQETAPDDFLSPAGLRYTRGGPEGHRLLHIERHLKDDPTRPGSHGVFDGDMTQVVRWLDEAYELAKRGAKGTAKHDEGDGRTRYEASFSKPIGYVGGRDGKRDNNPDARKVRIILEGNKVITAFPIK